jgi:hypothetical protein
MAQTPVTPRFALIDVEGTLLDDDFTGDPGVGQRVVEVPPSYPDRSDWSAELQGWEDSVAGDLIQPFKLFLRLSSSQLTALRTSGDDEIQNSLFLLTFSQVDGVRLDDEVVTGLADAMVTAGILDGAGRSAFLAAQPPEA